MGHLEVDAAALDDTARGLRRCVDVAREVHDHHGRLTNFVADSGSRRLTAAAEHFIGRWVYGMGLLVGDAEALAAQLEKAADQYRRLEADITEAAR